MTSTQNPTITEVRRYLAEDNGWTAEELEQLEGYFFRVINADGTTTLTRDQWEIAIMAYCDEQINFK